MIASHRVFLILLIPCLVQRASTTGTFSDTDHQKILPRPPHVPAAQPMADLRPFDKIYSPVELAKGSKYGLIGLNSADTLVPGDYYYRMPSGVQVVEPDGTSYHEREHQVIRLKDTNIDESHLDVLKRLLEDEIPMLPLHHLLDNLSPSQEYDKLTGAFVVPPDSKYYLRMDTSKRISIMPDKYLLLPSTAVVITSVGDFEEASPGRIVRSTLEISDKVLADDVAKCKNSYDKKLKKLQKQGRTEDEDAYCERCRTRMWRRRVKELPLKINFSAPPIRLQTSPHGRGEQRA